MLYSEFIITPVQKNENGAVTFCKDDEADYWELEGVTGTDGAAESIAIYFSRESAENGLRALVGLQTMWSTRFEHSGKHSPGPYSVEFEREEGQEEAIYISSPAGGNSLVCKIPLWYNNARANGALLSSSTELKAALIYLREQTTLMDRKYGIELSEGEEDADRMAVAALAKANRKI